jgi:hypothetical protein
LAIAHEQQGRRLDCHQEIGPDIRGAYQRRFHAIAFRIIRSWGAAMDRPINLRKAARRLGVVVVGLLAVDLVATVITLALGWEMFKG